MRLNPSDLCGKPIELDASLLGIHAIMAPQADRVLAVLLTSQFRAYTLFIRQARDGVVELSVEATPPDPDRTHPQAERSRIIAR